MGIEAILYIIFNICDDILVCEQISNTFIQNEKFGEVSSEMRNLHHKEHMLQK